MLKSTDELASRVEALFEDATIEAVVRDGWPRPMVEAGFELHRKTWDVEAIAAGLQAELDTLPQVPDAPKSMTHVWPALPGAGVTPVLCAALLGVETQRIRASRRGANFAARFAEVFELELTESLDAERVVVSGTDETVDAVCASVGADRVVGYGDRQSFAVVVEDNAAARHADALARDIVMWFGRGCFSAHAVLYLGDQQRAEAFAARLAESMAVVETELAPEIDEAMFAERAQAMGVAQFETKVWPARLGWVELRDSWDGAPQPANVVTFCIETEPSTILRLPVENRQGAVWAGPTTFDPAVLQATRICKPGQLQAPEPSWPHDGVGNAAALLGLRSGRI